MLAHTKGNDAIAYFDAWFESGTKCGQQIPITGWTNSQDRYSTATESANINSAQFSASTGTYTVPIAGAYQCCMSARCKQGGVCDFTMRLK